MIKAKVTDDGKTSIKIIDVAADEAMAQCVALAAGAADTLYKLAGKAGVNKGLLIPMLLCAVSFPGDEKMLENFMNDMGYQMSEELAEVFDKKKKE